MKEQPEALRLAEFCEGNVLYQPAAAELRRLHAEVERLSWDSIHTCHAECQRPLCKLTRERDALRQIVQDFPPVEAELREVSDRAHRLEAQRDALLEALKKAVENRCATVYANEHDECGERGCCGVVSYKPHADDCWVTTGCAAIAKAAEGENHAKNL